MATKKITKKDVLTVVKEIGAQAGYDTFTVDGVTISGNDIVEYAEKTIEQIEKKAESAKKRAEKAKAAGDELREKVASVLTYEFQTIPEIVNAIGDEELTRAKVTARLTQLVKLDQAHKAKVKTADGRAVNGYAAGPAPEVTESEE